MRHDLQREFLRRADESSHRRLITQIEQILGTSIGFRVCEMPIFVSHDMRRTLEEAAIALTIQSISSAVTARTTRCIPDSARVPNESDRPLFSVVDFAITMNEEGALVPKLIELQGFPSLFGYQLIYTSQMQNVYDLADTTAFCSNLSYDAYTSLLDECIVAGHPRNEVALVELDPLMQKTRPDFLALEQLIGLRTINIRDIVIQDRSLIYTDHRARQHQLRRVFNRAIVDELNEKQVSLGFSWTDDLNVEWAGHPNWYFLMSKASMPFLSHGSVPRSQLLSEIDQLPHQLDGYVLKPLYAFAGKGVVVAPKESDIVDIPNEQRHEWMLQERVEYARCIPTPHGNNAVEIRIMSVWPDRFNEPLPVMSLARTGRGAYMGARYNTEPWTGSSGCLFV